MLEHAANAVAPSAEHATAFQVMLVNEFVSHVWPPFELKSSPPGDHSGNALVPAMKRLPLAETATQFQ